MTLDFFQLSSCFGLSCHPDKASELGRRGGRKNRLWVPSEKDALPPLDNAAAIRDTVTRLITETYTGQLDPKIAAGLDRLLNLLMRTIGATELEQRVVALERARTETEAKDHSGADQDCGPGGSEP
jgi:hypothetical protein